MMTLTTFPRAILTALLALVVLVGCGGEAERGEGAAQQRALILATTTSTQDSGLLDELVPAFQRASGRQVRTIAVGSGQALELGRRGEADVLLVHSPEAERELMATGAARSRRIVMHNDFVLVGPQEDPAAIRGRDAVRALRRVAARRAPFVSRGDDSGTHTRELDLWEQAGRRPGGPWYVESGQGMGATLRIADERRAYTLTDRGTLLANEDTLELPVLVEGDRPLLNVYHVIDMTRRAGARVDEAGARAFADWVVGTQAQAMIGRFGRERFGRPLFVPDARRTGAHTAAVG